MQGTCKILQAMYKLGLLSLVENQRLMKDAASMKWVCKIRFPCKIYFLLCNFIFTRET